MKSASLCPASDCLTGAGSRAWMRSTVVSDRCSAASCNAQQRDSGRRGGTHAWPFSNCKKRTSRHFTSNVGLKATCRNPIATIQALLSLRRIQRYLPLLLHHTPQKVSHFRPPTLLFDKRIWIVGLEAIRIPWYLQHILTRRKGVLWMTVTVIHN